MTGGTTCCVPGCANTTLSAKHVSWHHFPKDNHLRNIWVKRINRKGTTGRFSLWTPTSNSRICGAHFNLAGGFAATNETGRKKYEDKAPRFFPTRTLPKYVAACPKVTCAGKRHALQPQSLPLQACFLSDLDLGQTVTLPASQEPARLGCPLTSGGTPDTGD
ncbi:unnamed protein product, partial [Ixodes hexagonus]